MGINSQPEPSTSKFPPSSSTRAVLDFLRIGATLEAAAPRSVQKEDDQPSVEALAALGIKVRDFAYESTLPPIAPFVRSAPPVRRQIQPGLSALQYPDAGPSSAPAAPPQSRRLKRTREDGTEEPDLGYGFVMGVARRAPAEGPLKPRKLQRTETEASLQPEGSQASLPPRRGNALLSLDDEAALRAAAYDVFGGSQPADSQSQGYYQEYSQQSQGYSQEYSQSQGNSQDTDFVKTPFVTPNGSLQWIGDSPPLVPTEPASEQCSTSRVLTPPPGSPTPAPLRRTSPRPPQLLGTGTPTPPASPLTAPAPLIANAPTPPATATPPPALARTGTITDTGTLSRTFSSLSTLSSPLSEPPPSQNTVPAPGANAAVEPSQPHTPTPSPPPRYHLRKRTGATAPASPVRSPKRRGRPAPRREESLAVVIQS